MLFLGVVGFVLLICCAQRRQPPAGARDGAHARAGRSFGAWRRPPPHHPAAADREPRPRRSSAARSGSRVGAAILQRGAVAHPAGSAARGRDALVRPARRRLLRGAALIVGAAVRHRAGVAGHQLLVAGSDGLRQPHDHRWRRRGFAGCSSSAKSPPRCCCSLAQDCCCGRWSRWTRSIAATAPRACSRCWSIRSGRNIRRRRPCSSFTTRSKPRSGRCLVCTDVAWTSSLPLDSFDDGGYVYDVVGDPPRRREPEAADRVSDRQPHLLLHARSAGCGRPRVRWPRHARGRARVHRERGVRRFAQRPLAHRDADCLASGVGSAGTKAGGPRNRRRRAPGQGPSG